MVADAPFELFKLVGVSFEGRQEVLKTVEPGRFPPPPLRHFCAVRACVSAFIFAKSHAERGTEHVCTFCTMYEGALNFRAAKSHAVELFAHKCAPSQVIRLGYVL